MTLQSKQNNDIKKNINNNENISQAGNLLKERIRPENYGKIADFLLDLVEQIHMSL